MVRQPSARRPLIPHPEPLAAGASRPGTVQNFSWNQKAKIILDCNARKVYVNFVTNL
jgi:hypothetical protein